MSIVSPTFPAQALLAIPLVFEIRIQKHGKIRTIPCNFPKLHNWGQFHTIFYNKLAKVTYTLINDNKSRRRLPTSNDTPNKYTQNLDWRSSQTVPAEE